MSVKTFDFLKIQNSKLLVCEIRPVKCSVNTNTGRLKTTKWMNFQHWKELRFLLKTIAEDYENARNNLKIAEDIKHGKPQNKISDSIKIAYMWALNKECCRHFLTPRQDTCWSDTEDDPISLNDKGGRYKSWQACGDMLVVSVALLDETEIQRNQKSSKSQHDTKSHRATSECMASSQYLDRSLIMALDPTLVSETPSISEYFTTQTSDTKLSNSDLDESRNIKQRILKSKSRAPENTNKLPLQQNNLSMEDIQTTRKKHPRSYFDTDSSEGTEVQLKSSCTSSDSQAEAAASNIILKAPTLSSEYGNLCTDEDDKKEIINRINDINLKKNINRVDLPQNNSTNDYSHKKPRCSFSVSWVEMEQQNQKSYILENIKVENSDSPDETNENNANNGFKFSFSSRLTPRISSPVDENCIESPEPHLKVGNSPTSTNMIIDNSLELHPELNTFNELEVFSFDSNTQSKSVQNASKSDLIGKSIKNQYFCTEIAKNKEQEIQKYRGLKSFREISKNNKTKKEGITKKYSENNLQMGTKDLDQEIQNKIPSQHLDQNYTTVEYDEQVEKKSIKNKSSHSLKPHENCKTKYIRNRDCYKSKFLKDKEIFQIENESNSGNEFSYFIPHTTEEITDNQLHNFQTEESVLSAKNAIETSELPVSVMTVGASMSRMNKRLEQPGDMYSSVYAHDVNKDECNSPRKGSEKKIKIGNEIKGKFSTKNYCKIRTRSNSIDVSQTAIASPDLFGDNSSEEMDTELSRTSKFEAEINDVSKTVEEEIFKDLIPKKQDTINIAAQYISTAHDCLVASESKSVSETDNVDINNDFPRTPEKVLSATCKLSNMERSPILGKRALQIKNKNHMNSSLQSGTKRLKKKRGICNIKNKDSKSEETIASKCLRKGFKGLDQIQESENDMKEDIEDIFELGNSSKNCIKNRKTLDEIMKKNDREELKKSNDEVLEINPIEIIEPNPLQMKILQYNSIDDDDDDDSNDDDLDLPDLGHAQDYEVAGNIAESLDDVSSVTIKHVLIKEKEKSNIKIKSVTDILSLPTKRNKSSEYFKIDKYIPAKVGRESDVQTKKSNIKIKSVTDILSSPTKSNKSSEYFKIDKYIPAKVGRESDVPYCPTTKPLCADEENISNKKEECVSNVEETNISSLECSLEENSISSCTESAESPDTRRSQRIKSIKGPKSCCLGCENMDEYLPCKDKKSSKTKTKTKTNDSEQSVEYPYIKSYVQKNVANKDGDLIKTSHNTTQRKFKSSSIIGDTGKNGKSIKRKYTNLKRTDKSTLDHFPDTAIREDLKESCEDNNENNDASSILADNLFKMSSEQKNDSINISFTGTENDILEKLDDTQVLLDGVSLDDLECDKVQPMDKTKKAMAEFDKMYKNFKSRRKKQGPDITKFMDSCQVTKKAKQIKSTRKKSNVNRKFKMTNLPDNQSKLNCWVTTSNKKSNPSLHVEAPKASGSKDFENVSCENNPILFEQSLSKDTKKGEKRKKKITNSRPIKKHRLSESSSEKTFEDYAPDEGRNVQENKSSNQDHRENEPLTCDSIELDENSSSTSVPPVEDNRTSTSGISDQIDSSVIITHEEKIPTEAEKASLIARNLEVMDIEKLETLVMQHLPYLKKVAKGEELNQRHTIYMKGGAEARFNTPEVIFAPFTDEQLEHIHSVLRIHLLQKLVNNNIEGKEYLWMVLVPTFLIRLVMDQEQVSYDDAELLFKHMAFPKRPNRDSLGLGEPW